MPRSDPAITSGLHCYRRSDTEPVRIAHCAFFLRLHAAAAPAAAMPAIRTAIGAESPVARLRSLTVPFAEVFFAEVVEAAVEDAEAEVAVAAAADVVSAGAVVLTGAAVILQRGRINHEGRPHRNA